MTNIANRLILAIWDLSLHLLMPIILIYFYKRSRQEPSYFTHLGQRFGGGKAIPEGSIWIHTVSLGEFRAARALIDALIDRGETVTITTMTAAGRDAIYATYKEEIDHHRIHLRWIPLDLSWACTRFFNQHKFKLGIICEIELWPQLITKAKKSQLPLVMVQAQYPEKSYIRDKKGSQFRASLVQKFDLILAKSTVHAQRFRDFGATNVDVMGELRFELPIAPHLLDAATQLKSQLAANRPILCLASTAPDEDDILIDVMNKLKAHTKTLNQPQPFFIYVPRHPKNFSNTFDKLSSANLHLQKRSHLFDQNLKNIHKLDPESDGIYGDSLGEIYFYFSLSDHVFMGDSFNGEGSHNIIEPLRTGKPVVVGPSTWCIEYPAIEALECGLLTIVQTPEELLNFWMTPTTLNQSTLSTFLAQHGGATKRSISLLKHHNFI